MRSGQFEFEVSRDPALDVPVKSRKSGGNKKRGRKTKSSAGLFSRLWGFCWRLGLMAALLLLAVIGGLNWLNPPTSAFMLASPYKPVKQSWVDIEHISAFLPRAVVASEDQRFAKHVGVDFKAIGDAMEDNAERERVRGGSTLTQQTAKNLFLWQGGYLRKAVEAGLAIVMDALLPKKRILEIYLNIAEFAPGVYGAEAGARHWFGIPAAQLNEQQAAQMAAILPSPRKWQANPPGQYVSERAQWIQTQMRQTGANYLAE